MKIALCISGEIRHGFAAFPYIYNSFLNQRNNVDVFIHSWEYDKDLFELYSAKLTSLDECEPTREYLLETLNLNKSVSKDFTSNVGNNLLMYFGINKSISLVDDTYDILIRIRPDMYLNKKLDFDKIISDIGSNKYDIQIPSPQYNFGGYNDQIAIGNYKSMKIYGDFINHIESVSNENNFWHSETLLKKYLDKLNIKVNQIDYEYKLLRDVTLRLSSTIFEDKPKETKIIY
jgi:hypothetical protein